MTSQAIEDPETSVQVASRTDVGRIRSANEDSYGSFERADGTRLFVVADGMGGHQGGATASHLAVATIAEFFHENASPPGEEMLRQAIEAANDRIFRMAHEDPDLEGMGTTVVAFLLVDRRRGCVAHVGDSRAYRHREGRLEPLTIDHSVVAEMHRRGLISAEEAESHPRRNEILRSVGVLPEVEVETAPVAVDPGDRFVLCSDGLSGVVRDDEIEAVVGREMPESATETLIQWANDRGGPDNITVQVLAVPGRAIDEDPGDTTPIELSEAGLRAIAARRSHQGRSRHIALVVAALALLGVLYLAWRLAHEPSGPSLDPATTAPAVPDPSAPPNRDGATPREDRFETEQEAPRRGIPR